ncbi:Protein kinase APK1A, chloroplastic [Hordeum vulgare]|nr:Protein kinase APK1A, chloroplastic [Hordeum vulgare]
MAVRFLDDGAAANCFGRRRLHEDEARLLYEADYPMPSNMRVQGSWRLSTGGVPVSSPPSRDDRWAEIARIWSSLPESSRNLSRYAPESNTLWTAYFERRHADQLAAANRVEPCSCHNSEGRRQRWGIPGRTLEAVLEHIEGGNSSRFEYPAPPAFSHRRGSSSMPRRMETTLSSSFGSRSRSSGSPALLPVKPEPQETPLGHHTRSCGIITNEPGASSRLVKPKTELGLLPAKEERVAMGAYVREKERQRRSLEEIAARCRMRKEDGVVILDNSDEEVSGPSNPVRHGDPRQGCSNDGNGA